MTRLKILTYPDPILRRVADPVASVTKDIARLVDDMFETMYAATGVGLAAPQVGVSQRILVLDVGLGEEEKRKPDPHALINPEIIEREGLIVWEEGCLSCPELLVQVERSQRVVVSGLSPEGKPITISGTDLLAVAFQHEIDHLDGITLVDRLSRLKRDLYLTKLKKGEPLPEGLKNSGKRYI